MKSEQERQQTPKKKGLFGFGYATDTGEFEPINVSVSGRVENQSTQQLEEQLPRSQEVLPQDEPDEMELREQEPPRHYAAKKKGFFASLFGGKKHDVYDELESYDPYEGEPAPVENWEVPEQPREEPETEETGEMPRLTATNAGLSISGRQTSQFAATGKPQLSKDSRPRSRNLSPMFTAKIKSGIPWSSPPARSGNAPCRSLGLPPAAKRNPWASRS